MFQKILVKWAKCKYKRLKGSWLKAAGLDEERSRQHEAPVHPLGSVVGMPMAECEEPYDGRLSRTVPRETGGETPPVYSTQPDNADKPRCSLNEC